MLHLTILRKLHRQRLHKSMGKPRRLCRLLEQRGLRTPHRNVQLVRGIEAWSLWAQLEREEGLLPLPEPPGQLERGLCRLLWRSLIGVALRHLGQHQRGVYRPLPVWEFQIRRIAERDELLVREQGAFSWQHQRRRMRHSLSWQRGSDLWISHQDEHLRYSMPKLPTSYTSNQFISRNVYRHHFVSSHSNDYPHYISRGHTYYINN